MQPAIAVVTTVSTATPVPQKTVDQQAAVGRKVTAVALFQKTAKVSSAT